jgi:hypothetical protein
VQLSRDGGTTWANLATHLIGTSLDWTATGALTDNAIVRVLAYDTIGSLLGWDDTDEVFTIASQQLGPPLPIDGSALLITFDGATVRLDWKAPVADTLHGPASHYRIMRGSDPQSLTEVATTVDPLYTEAAADTAGTPLTYYRIIAVNAAGETP